MALRTKILAIVKNSERALSIREICCLVNSKPLDYCMNVDGKGSRCKYFYRRPKHEKQRIKLVKPDCRYSAIAVIQAVNALVQRGLINKKEMYLRDKYSVWGYDKFRLCYIDTKQIRNRLKVKNLEEVDSDGLGDN